MINQISPSASAPAVSQPDNRAARSAASHQEALVDAELVLRFNGGDQAAFVEIVTRYRSKMFHVALGMLRNRADAEEIVQDTFIRAHRALAKFRGDSSLATWLNRITINLARNRYWYFFRRRRHTTSSIDRAFSENSNATFADLLAADAAGPAREAVSNEFSNLVSACMERLGAQPREILALRVSQNRTYDEIALALGINVGTVKSRIGRARKGLRALLAEACPEFGTAAEPSDWFESFRPAGEVRIVSA